MLAKIAVVAPTLEFDGHFESLANTSFRVIASIDANVENLLGPDTTGKLAFLVIALVDGFRQRTGHRSSAGFQAHIRLFLAVDEACSHLAETTAVLMVRIDQCAVKVGFAFAGWLDMKLSGTTAFAIFL